MIVLTVIILLTSCALTISQSWSTSDGLLPWESYVQLANVTRALGVTLNRSSLAHHHFAVGYTCLQSFMYDEANNAFDLAINVDPTFVGAGIGKMLACKQPLSVSTDFACGLAAYNATRTMLDSSNIAPSSLQSALVTTVYQWYANQSSVEAGELAFLASIETLSIAYPNETDVRALWGLSLLNVASQRQYEGQMEPEPMLRAREVLKVALASAPNDPGVLNYLIRAYDVAQSDIAAMAIGYVLTYQSLPSTLSYPKHLAAQIWMRTGSLALAKSSDEASLNAGRALCLIKSTGRNMSIASYEFVDILGLLNATQVEPFLLCDIKNRATATEWLSFSRLQTGNWNGTLSPIDDLYLAYNLSNPPSALYLSYAYRTRARALVNIFYWLPYDAQFISKGAEVQRLGGTLDFIASAANATDWDVAWSEAGYRFSSCLRLLTNINSSYADPTVKATIDDHLARFAVLANQTAPLSKYISTSISLMIPQVQGIIYYTNNSLQQCISALDGATQREMALVMDVTSPTLIFGRSSELLAMHLLLIQRRYVELPTEANRTTFMLNGSRVAVSEFPRYALNLYAYANVSAPNRAINILGTARAYSQLRLNNAAERFYQILLDQISMSNRTDPIFAQEAQNFIGQKGVLTGSADRQSVYYPLLFTNFVLFCLFFVH